MSIDRSLPVWSMTAREFEQAVRDMENDVIRQQRAAADKRNLRAMGVKLEGDEESEDAPPPGIETGTTTSTARAPAAHGGSSRSNALEMTDSEWQAAVRSLK